MNAGARRQVYSDVARTGAVGHDVRSRSSEHSSKGSVRPLICPMSGEGNGGEAAETADPSTTGQRSETNRKPAPKLLAHGSAATATALPPTGHHW